MIKRYAYPEFEANQVLSFQHLNQLTEFLEGQDRLGRRALIGAGVVRGLEVEWREGSGLVLSPGVALTSVGHLAVVETPVIHTARRTYTPPGGYAQFPEGTTLWEMLPADSTEDPPGEPLTKTHVEGHTALLFLEMISADLDRCIGDHCINQGREHQLVWRVLLLPNASAVTIRLRSLGLPTKSIKLVEPIAPNNITTASIETGIVPGAGSGVSRTEPLPLSTPTSRLLSALYPAWLLPVPTWEKFLLTPGIVISHEAIAQRAEEIFRDAPGSFARALSLAVSLLATPLGLDDQVADAVSRFQSNFDSALTNLRTRRNIGWQHLWDHLRHLHTAYLELREAAFAWHSRLTPTAEAFPLHVFLGALPTADTLVARIYRTEFIPSPALSIGGRDEDLCRHRLERLLQLARSFTWPEPEPLRITPGARWNSIQARRAIPFFYAPDAVLSAWSKTALERHRVDHQFSYHRDHLSSEASSQDPLRFEVEGADFFRIEGHQGRRRSEVEKFLDDQRQSYDLPFRVITVRYGAAQSGTSLSPGDLEDIDALYTVSVAEMKCHLNRLLSLLSNLAKPKRPLTDIVLVEAGNRLKIDFTHFVLLGTEAFTLSPATGPIPTTTPVTDPVEQPINPVLLTNVTRFKTAARITLAQPSNTTFSDNRTTAAPTTTTANISSVSGRLFDFEFIPLPDLVLPQVDARTRVNLLVQELLGRLTHAGEQLPEEIAEFQSEELASNLSEARNRARNLQLALTDLLKTPDYKPQGFENDLLEELGSFQANCIPTRLIQITAEWTRRFERIKALPTLGSFISSHPGLEHRSGVCAGGTLVLVIGRPASPRAPGILPVGGFQPQPVPPITLRPPVAITPTNPGIASLMGTVSRVSAPSNILLSSLLSTKTPPAELSTAASALTNLIQTSLDRKDQAISLNLSSQLIELLNDLALRPPQAEEDVVLADFYLPYVCCTERTQVNYIVMPELQLSLPRPNFRNDDRERYPFTVLPPNGKLEGPGVERADDGSFLFAPSAAGVPVGSVRFTYSVSGRSVGLTVQVEGPPSPPPPPPPPSTPLAASFKFEIIERAPNAALIQFTNTATGNPDKFEWNFGDGNSSSEVNPSNLFKIGRWIVVLKIKRGTQTAEAKREIVIEVIAPPAPVLAADFSFKIGTSTVLGTSVSFKNTSTGNALQSQWDFGNGQSSTENNPKPVRYLKSGKFEVKLVVTSGNETARTTKAVVIPDRDVIFPRDPTRDPFPTPIPGPGPFPTPIPGPGPFPTPIPGPGPDLGPDILSTPGSPGLGLTADRLAALRNNALFSSSVGGIAPPLARNLESAGDTLARASKERTALDALTKPSGEAEFGNNIDAALKTIVAQLTTPPAVMTAEEALHLFKFGAELSASTLAAFAARGADLDDNSPVLSATMAFAKELPGLRRRSLTRKLGADDSTLALLNQLGSDATKPVLAKAASTLVKAFTG